MTSVGNPIPELMHGSPERRQEPHNVRGQQMALKTIPKRYASAAEQACNVRGTKRTCQSEACGARFYDLNRDRIECPMCGAAYVPYVEVQQAPIVRSPRFVPRNVPTPSPASLDPGNSPDVSDAGDEAGEEELDNDVADAGLEIDDEDDGDEIEDVRQSGMARAEPE